MSIQEEYQAEVHEACIEIIRAKKLYRSLIDGVNSTMRAFDGLEMSKLKRNKEIYFKVIERLDERYGKQIKKLNREYFTEEDVYDMSICELDLTHPNPDNIHDLAERMDLEYDEEAQMYFDPNDEIEVDAGADLLKALKRFVNNEGQWAGSANAIIQAKEAIQKAIGEPQQPNN